jgi:hypothetical protein
MKTYEKPTYRRLWGYAFDPSLSNSSETASINDLIFKVRWDDYKSPGPVGEYIEIIDYDPPSGKFYDPIDLNEINVIANDGVKPSESNPHFHQQMVYAVAMTTIQNFEKALGRWILWSPRVVKDKDKYTNYYIPRLRIYPHAFREANAYYNPNKKAILFGYFPAISDNTGIQLPGGVVFTCLSHDIIAHEVTHAILDGINTKLIDENNPDTLAFHEAFSDIIALFQHFSFKEVIKNQIARTRGDLKSQNLLGELAQQFGNAIGNYGSLRDAIGKVNPKTRLWESTIPDPDDYLTKTEPHDRGSILVAAIFEAFTEIYKMRVKDLLRIASDGTGILPIGELHPDLVNRLASEASKSAQHVLNICIRALDYLPPVDMNFGDFLRAMITADYEIAPEDSYNYRIIIIEAFRKRGIYPEGIKTLSVQSLIWNKIDFESIKNNNLKRQFSYLQNFIKDFLNQNQDAFKDREKYYNTHQKFKEFLHEKFHLKFDNVKDFENITGLIFNNLRNEENDNEIILNINRNENQFPKFFVQSLAINRRIDFNGKINNQAFISIVQNSKEEIVLSNGDNYTFKFFGGATLVFDLDSSKLLYAIKKDIRDIKRYKSKRDYVINRLSHHDDNALQLSFNTSQFLGQFASLHNSKH